MKLTCQLTEPLIEPKQEPIITIIENIALQQPNTPAITADSKVLTYRQLIDAMNLIVGRLHSNGMYKGSIVAICGEKNLATMIVFLAVMKLGAVSVLINKDLPLLRQQAMLDESKANIVIFTVTSVPDLNLNTIKIFLHLEDDDLMTRQAGENNVYVDIPKIFPDDPAYIFFTSGTTGKPKGILGCHKSLTHFINWQKSQFKIGRGDKIAQLASISFDAFLKDFFLALTSGATLILPINNPYEYPEKILHWLNSNEISVIQTVPSVVASWLVVEDFSGITLEKVRLICLAGEPVSNTLIDRWRHQFPKCKAEIYNLYGPTETTILKSYYKIPDQMLPGIQSIGQPIPEVQLLILNSYNKLCGVRELGEIIIRTPFRTLGYINATAEENARFFVNPYREDQNDIFYRTGDLGRFERDGSVSIQGRVDDEIKIRGVRVNPIEIASQIMDYPGVKQAIVRPYDEQSELQLAAYLVLNDKDSFDKDALKNYLSQRLQQALIPAFYMLLDNIPLLPNGKLDKSSLPKPDSVTEEKCLLQPISKTQSALLDIWKQVLKKEKISIDANFFDLGGHSLSAIQVIAKIRKIFQVDFSIKDFFNSPKIINLSNKIDDLCSKNERSTLPALIKIDRNKPIPLSLAQKRLWYMYLLAPSSAFYSNPCVLELNGVLNITLLEKCIQEIFNRHEILHCRINPEKEPTLVLDNTKRELIEIINLENITSINEREHVANKMIIEDINRAFNLTEGPLIRIRLFCINEKKKLLLFNIHHIISDVTSGNVLVNELTSLWNAFSNNSLITLPELPIQYLDFAYWQNKCMENQLYDSQLEFWEKTIGDYSEYLELPVDFIRPEIQTFNGAYYHFYFPEDVTMKLKKFSSQNNVTLFIVLLAVFKLLLYRYTLQTDIIVGTDISGRNHVELENLIGFFVNTLALRVKINEDSSFLELLENIRETVLQAFNHQDIPFEKVIEQIHPSRSLSRSPLFSVMFRMWTPPEAELNLNGLEAIVHSRLAQSAKFELTLALSEKNNTIYGEFEYNTDIFSEERIRIFHLQYEYLLKQILDAPKEKITCYKLQPLSLLSLLPDPTVSLEIKKYDTIVSSVIKKAIKCPKNNAIYYNGFNLTYKDLVDYSMQFSSKLIQEGVAKEDVVAIHSDKVYMFFVAVISIFTIGGIVLPIDSNLPMARKLKMVEKSKARFLINITDSIIDNLDENLKVIKINNLSNISSSVLESIKPITLDPSSPAYIFFTSGSSGEPKAILGCHKSITHFIEWESNELKVIETDRIAQLTSISFDAILRDMFLPFVNGAALCIPTKECLDDPIKFLVWLHNEKITILHTVPSVLSNMLINSDQKRDFLTSLRFICLSGEPLPGKLIHDWNNKFSDSNPQFINFYGPTETTMIKSFYYAPKFPILTNLPVGLALPGAQLLIFNSEFNLCGMGELGEIAIRTPYSTLGYLNETEELNQRFISNPFTKNKNDIIYLTGDKGRYRIDGSVEILGRNDDEVKIRGVRIQPQEIIKVLNRHEAVINSFVLAYNDSDGEVKLNAYIIFKKDHTIASLQIRNYLSEYLPQAMIPEGYHSIDKIPLLTNGKVDKKNLLAIGEKISENSIVPPKTTMQKRILALWEEVLHCSPISIEANFFDIGGHSLLATYLITRIRQEINTELSLRAFLENPTIKGLSGLLDMSSRNNKGNEKSAIVLLKDSKKNIPIFLFHPIGGGVSCYYELVKTLKYDGPIYGLQAPGLESNTNLIENIDELSQYYFDNLRSVYSEGPYCLIGWSLGGFFAYEVARNLYNDGERIDSLILIDSVAPSVNKKSLKTISEEKLLLWMAADMARIANIEFTHSSEVIRDVSSHLAENIIKEMIKYKILPEKNSVDEFNRYFQIYKNHITMATNYNNKNPFPIDLTILAAHEGEHWKNTDINLGWNEHTNGRITSKFVPGDHYSLMMKPGVSALANEIDQILIRNK